MKKIIYMAQSVNGYIAKPDNETPWSEDEWKCFNEKVQECKNLVIGSKTFSMMKEQINSPEFKNIQVVVVLNKEGEEEKENIKLGNSPEQAVEFLNSENFETMFIGGGAILNSSFIKSGLVDEIYFDIEPKIFNSGIPFFTDEISDIDLELLEVKQTGKNSVQLHYKILK